MAAVEHAVKERVEGIFCRPHDVCKALRTLRQEVETKHTSDAVGGEGHAGSLGGSLKSLDQTLGLSAETIVEARR